MFLAYAFHKWQSSTHKLQCVSLCFPVFMPVATSQRARTTQRRFMDTQNCKNAPIALFINLARRKLPKCV